MHSGGISISLNEGTRISMGLEPTCISFPLSMETPWLRDSEIVPSKWWPKLKKEVLPLGKNACACGFTHVLREFNEEPEFHFLVQNHHLFLDSLISGYWQLSLCFCEVLGLWISYSKIFSAID